MEFRYDFHLHSCLSPCGDRDMTPYHIVAMAKLLELDVIALTDHNTSENCPSILEAGQEAGLLVLPGMELTTAEEIHMVCLFPHLEEAMEFSQRIKSTLPPVKNRPEIFGEQLRMNAREAVLGEEDILLLTASGYSMDQAIALCKEYGGVCYPAHVDRPAYSILAILGGIDPSMDFDNVEATPLCDWEELQQQHPVLKSKRLLRSSDSHYLEQMATFSHGMLELEELTAEQIIHTLKKAL